MSAGMIWYKTQPDSAIAATADKVLFDFCGSIVSHDTTVHPQNIAPMISKVFSRSNTVIIVGGLNAIRPEENIVFILSRTLNIPLETKIKSRSRYCFDTIRGIRLPSLAGSVLFPSRFGGPEGIMISSGKQTILVFPSDRNAAVGMIGSVNKFVMPRIRAAHVAKIVSANKPVLRDYEKFKRGNNSQSNVTRSYSEGELRETMENAVCEARYMDGRITQSIADDYNRRSKNDDSKAKYSEYYRKKAKSKKIKSIISLTLVVLTVSSLIVTGSYFEMPTFASSVTINNDQLEQPFDEKTKPSTTTSAQSTTASNTVSSASENIAAISTDSTEKQMETTADKVTTVATASTIKKNTAKKTTSTTKKTTAKKATSTTKKTTIKKTTSTTKKTTIKKTTSTTGKTTTKTAPAVNTPSSSTMRIKTNGKVVSGNTVDILASIVEAEMGSSYNIEALKAQAVASYTFYLYNGGSSKAPSFPTKKPGTRAKNAVKAVLGKKMKFNGKTPYTPYYAISAGKTASNATINGTSISYLKAVDCSVDKEASGYKTVKTYSASKVASKVKSNTGIDLNSIQDKSSWFKITERDSNDLYVVSVKVGSKKYRGSKLWLSILGSSYVRSDCYYISYSAASDSFTFTSYGYGHGVGMSQKGANSFAAQGKDYIWILKHFYSGVTIS